MSARVRAGQLPEAIPIAISDPADPRVDDYRRLSDARARRRLEAGDPAAGDPGFFVAEGVTVIRRLLASGRPVRSVLPPPRFWPPPSPPFGAGVDGPRAVGARGPPRPLARRARRASGGGIHCCRPHPRPRRRTPGGA